MARIKGAAIALLVATAIVPATAAAQGIYITRPKLAPCPQPANYLHAIEMKKKIAAEVKASHLPAANALLNQALAGLGTGYDPYHRAIDNTGQYLTIASYLERAGKLAAAIREKQLVLDDRLSMQVEPMLCNKIVLQIQH